MGQTYVRVSEQNFQVLFLNNLLNTQCNVTVTNTALDNWQTENYHLTFVGWNGEAEVVSLTTIYLNICFIFSKFSTWESIDSIDYLIDSKDVITIMMPSPTIYTVAVKKIIQSWFLVWVVICHYDSGYNPIRINGQLPYIVNEFFDKREILTMLKSNPNLP